MRPNSVAFAFIFALVCAVFITTGDAIIVSRGKHKGSKNGRKFMGNAAASNVALLRSDDCKYALELMHVQDASDSFNDDIENLISGLDTFLTELESRFPGSKFGLSLFRDKGFDHAFPEDNTCFISAAKIGSNAEQIKDALKAASIEGGGDYPENALGAMMRALLSPKSGWSDEDYTPEGFPIVRVLSMATDAPAHSVEYFSRQRVLDSDEEEATFWPSVQGKFVDLVTSEKLAVDDNAECDTAEYPSWKEFKQLLVKKRVIPLILTGNHTWLNEGDGKYYLYPDYRDYAHYYKQNSWLSMAWGLFKNYQWLLNDAGIDALLTRVSRDGSDLVTNLMSELETSLPGLVCKSTTTTTSTTKPAVSSTSEEDGAPTVPVVPPTAPPATEATGATSRSTAKPTTGAPTPKTATSKPGDTTEPAGKPTTASIEGGTTSTTTGAAAAGGGGAAAVIGGAAGGAAAAAAAGLVYAKKFGMSLPFSNNSMPDTGFEQDVDVPEAPLERETYENVTADMFT